MVRYYRLWSGTAYSQQRACCVCLNSTHAPTDLLPCRYSHALLGTVSCKPSTSTFTAHRQLVSSTTRPQLYGSTANSEPRSRLENVRRRKSRPTAPVKAIVDIGLIDVRTNTVVCCAVLLSLSRNQPHSPYMTLRRCNA